MTEREMKPPSDRDLTEKGLPLAPQTGRILLIACGALAREILDLKEANGWSHLDLTCLPAKLHLYPEKITDEVRTAVEKQRDKYDDIFVVYADCGTGGLLEAECEKLGVQMVAGPHCYSFFEGNDRFSKISEDEITTFYLTDFLVRSSTLSLSNPWGSTGTPTCAICTSGTTKSLCIRRKQMIPRSPPRRKHALIGSALPLNGALPATAIWRARSRRSDLHFAK